MSLVLIYRRGYVTNSFVLILYPAIASKVFLAVMIPIFVSELSLSLWLLIKGVNIRKWYERIGLQPVGSPA